MSALPSSFALRPQPSPTSRPGRHPSNIGADPVKSGLVSSLNRPNGNVTGVAALIESLGPKRLGLIHELLPDAGAVGVLFNPNSPTAEPQLEEIKLAARSISMPLHIVGARSTGDQLDEAFAALDHQGTDPLLVVPDPMLIDGRTRLVALANTRHIPTLYPIREFVEAGGLISYGTDLSEAIHQSGIYAARILKGATPTDLPVVQSVKLEMVINLKAAKAIGLEIPPTLLARADEVIE